VHKETPQTDIRALQKVAELPVCRLFITCHHFTALPGDKTAWAWSQQPPPSIAVLQYVFELHLYVPSVPAFAC